MLFPGDGPLWPPSLAFQPKATKSHKLDLCTFLALKSTLGAISNNYIFISSLARRRQIGMNIIKKLQNIQKELLNFLICGMGLEVDLFIINKKRLGF